MGTVRDVIRKEQEVMERHGELGRGNDVRWDVKECKRKRTRGCKRMCLFVGCEGNSRNKMGR